MHKIFVASYLGENQQKLTFGEYDVLLEDGLRELESRGKVHMLKSKVKVGLRLFTSRVIIKVQGLFKKVTTLNRVTFYHLLKIRSQPQSKIL